MRTREASLQVWAAGMTGMLDNQSLVTIFLSCVDAGSFAAAGRRLNLSRSSVGKAVGRLEDAMGVRLFHRSTRHQGLTEDGQIFLDYARRSQDALVAARQIFASGRLAPAGILRVSAPACLGRHCIGPLLMDMVGEYPDLQLMLSLGDQPIDLIDDGLDLSIRVGATVDAIGIIGRKIGTQVMGLYAAPAYLAKHGSPENVNDLEHHQMLVYSRGRTLKWRFASGGTGDRTSTVGTGKAQVDDLDLLADMAVRGFGIANLPQWLAGPHVRTGTLERLAGLEPRSFDVSVLWPQSDFVPTRVRAAVDYLALKAPLFFAERGGA